MTFRHGLIAVVIAVVGCRVPPAHPSACTPTAQSRRLHLTRQILTDSAVEVAAHPTQTLHSLVVATPDQLRAGITGLLGKRLVMRCRPGPIVSALAIAEETRPGPVAPTQFCFYVDPNEAMAALEQAISGATCRIDVLMYLWGNDPPGWHIARSLAARAGPNLPVRILIDGGGNLTQGKPEEANAPFVNEVVCWLARQPYVHVIRTRNPFARFDHRKLVVVDGQVAWGGGRNFTRFAFSSDHDLSYTVTGAPAARLAEVFEESWRYQGGPPAPPLPEAPQPGSPNAVARVVRTEPTHHELGKAVYTLVSHARQQVYIENPYLGDSRMVYLLARARARGADVRAVMSLDTRSVLYNRANRVTANRLLAAGVRVYLYPGMTHVKALAVDGTCAYVGSGNFDNLSLRRNREVGLVLSGPAVEELHRRVFLPDFNPAWEMTEPLDLSPLDYLYEMLAAVVG